MLGQRPPQHRRRQIAPEYAFLIARLLFDQAPARAAERGRYMVQYVRCRFVHRLEAGAIQTEGEIDVLEVAAEIFWEQADAIEGRPPIEAGGRAGAEDAAWFEIGRRDRLAM